MQTFRIFALVTGRSLAFILLLLPIAVEAQSTVEFAPIASFDFGSPLFINRNPEVLNPFAATVNGTSASESYGLGIQLRMPSLFAPQLGMVSRVQGIYGTGYFNFDNINYSIRGSEAKLLLEAGLTWDVGILDIRACPWVSQAIVRSITETNSFDSIITPSNAGSPNTHAGIFAGMAWNIPNFPLQPELGTHLDLSQLSLAGSKAWSFGISIAYVPSGSAPPIVARDTVISYRTVLDSNAASRSSEPLRILFLVNGEIQRTPTIDRVETQMKEYQMVEAPNASPKFSQWIEDSYHLPHISLLCQESNSAEILVRDNGLLLFDTSLSNGANSLPVLDLDHSPSWQRGLAQMKTTEMNQLVAEVRSDAGIAFDTLLLPPADSANATTVMTRHQFRFELLRDFAHYAGGGDALTFLIDKMKSLLEENPAITICAESSFKTSNLPLANRLERSFGTAWSGIEIQDSSNAPDYVTVVFEY